MNTVGEQPKGHLGLNSKAEEDDDDFDYYYYLRVNAVLLCTAKWLFLLMAGYGDYLRHVCGRKQWNTITPPQYMICYVKCKDWDRGPENFFGMGTECGWGKIGFCVFYPARCQVYSTRRRRLWRPSTNCQRCSSVADDVNLCQQLTLSLLWHCHCCDTDPVISLIQICLHRWTVCME